MAHPVRGKETLFTWILLKKILSQMLSLRMIPLLTSAPFLLAAKLSSQRFSGLLAWLKICRETKYTFFFFFFFFDWGQCLLVPTIKKFIQVHFPEINWKQVIPLYSKCMETTLCPIMLFSSLSVWRNQGGNVLIMANKTTLQPMSHDGSGNEFQLIVKPQSPVRVGVCFPNRAKNYFF